MTDGDGGSQEAMGVMEGRRRRLEVIYGLRRGWKVAGRYGWRQEAIRGHERP